MKKPVRLIALLLIAALAAGLVSGCGAEKSPADTSAGDTADAMVWSSAFLIPPELDGPVSYARIDGEGVYAAVTGMYSSGVNVSYGGSLGTITSYNEEYASDIEYAPVIYRIAADGSAAEKLPEYQPPTLAEGQEGNVSVAGLCPDGQGNLWVAEQAWAYHYELPADFSGTKEEQEEYYRDDGYTAFLRKLSSTGAELLSIDLSAISAGSSNFYIQDLRCDAQGQVYISNGDSFIGVFGADGAPLFNVELSDWLYGLINLADGTVAGCMYEQNGFAVKPLDTATKGWGAAISIDYPDGIYSGSGDNVFFYSSHGSLYGCKADGQSEKLLAWLDCDMNYNDIMDIAVNDDGSMLCVSRSSDSNGDGVELARLSQVSASEAVQKTVLTLAVMYTDYSLNKQVLKFNRSSDKYRITVKDYSEYNTEDDYEAGLKKLNTEIIAGTVPDIMSVEQLPVRQYASKGLLADLYPLIDADGELSRDSFIPSVLKALESDGHLYQAAPGFGVYTITGKADVVGDTPGWTLDELMACLDAQPEGTELFSQGITKNDMLQYVCFMNFDRLVNWETGQCNFNSDDFKQMLEFCTLFADSFEYSEATYESDVSRIRSGKQMLYLTGAYDFTELQMSEAMFGGNITFKGFPVSSGSGSALSLSSGLAISSTCKDIDGAWSFVRTMLTEEYQSGGDVWSFPTNQAAFDKMLAEAMKAEYTTDENGEQVEVSHSGMGWDDFYIEIYSVKPEQAEQIKSLIDSVDGAFSIDMSIGEILMDEAAAYFAGQKSIDETAELIQNRVSLYVSEQS